jgi:membrane protein involved in colicin uptake
MVKGRKEMKLKFNEVKYSFRKNLGNYESEETGLSASIEEGDVTEALQVLKDMVHGRAVKAKPKAVLPKKETRTLEAKPEDKVEETKEEVKAEPVKKEPAKKKVAKKTRKKKVATEVYDRTNDSHKKRLGELCNELFGGSDWRKDKDKITLVKNASQLCSGEETMVGEDGEVTDNFKSVFKELLKL